MSKKQNSSLRVRFLIVSSGDRRHTRFTGVRLEVLTMALKMQLLRLLALLSIRAALGRLPGGSFPPVRPYSRALPGINRLVRLQGGDISHILGTADSTTEHHDLASEDAPTVPSSEEGEESSAHSLSRGGAGRTKVFTDNNNHNNSHQVGSVTTTNFEVSTSTEQFIDAEEETTKPATGAEDGTQKKVSVWKRAVLKAKRHKRHKSIAKKLRNRNATNKRRKFMHCSFGLCFAAANHFIPKSKFVPGMAILSSATLVMELLRYKPGFGWMNDGLHFVLGKALRKHEMGK